MNFPIIIDTELIEFDMNAKKEKPKWNWMWRDVGSYNYKKIEAIAVVEHIGVPCFSFHFTMDDPDLDAISLEWLKRIDPNVTNIKSVQIFTLGKILDRLEC